ncbi:MAG: hypothetical protein H6832_18940 [Planctomycetes bacterium]|nr:hypothetical protein [Planctomycetota bacterium]MCB9920487.1 hypothetical protein [Planctomycetota bacterium]
MNTMTLKGIACVAMLFGAWPANQDTLATIDSLVAATPDKVLETWGVPNRVTASACALSFEYDGEQSENARFVFHDGIAVVVPAATVRPKARTTPPAKQLYVGQSLRDALAHFGAAESTVQSAMSLEVRLGGKRVGVAHGRIVSVR